MRHLTEAEEFERDYQDTLQRFTDYADKLRQLNGKLDTLVSKINAGEFDKVDAPERAAAVARIRTSASTLVQKLSANLRAATAHADQAKSNAFQAMVLAGLIFKYLFGKKKDVKDSGSD